MNEIQLTLDEKGKGAFFIAENGERIAEMVIRISGQDMTVYHTEVSEKLKGQNIGKALLLKMVEYARQQQLKVIPLCKFVDLQFKRYPEEYADVKKS